MSQFFMASCHALLTSTNNVRLRSKSENNIIIQYSNINVCPRSSGQFYIGSCYIKWFTTSWTHSIFLAIFYTTLHFSNDLIIICIGIKTDFQKFEPANKIKCLTSFRWNCNIRGKYDSFAFFLKTSAAEKIYKNLLITPKRPDKMYHWSYYFCMVTLSASRKCWDPHATSTGLFF